MRVTVCNVLCGLSQPAEIDNSETLLIEDDQHKSVAGPEPDDSEAAVIKQAEQADDVVDQPALDNVRTQLNFFCDYWIL